VVPIIWDKGGISLNLNRFFPLSAARQRLASVHGEVHNRGRERRDLCCPTDKKT
jgi:hypothetical protein